MSFLNAMDKYFFGKPLTSYSTNKTKSLKQSTKFVEDSFDDWCKHVDFMYNAFRRPRKPLEKTPAHDTFNDKVAKVSIEKDAGRNFFGSIFGQ